MTHTIHPTKHIDYSRGDRVDHLFVIGENTEFGGRMDPRRSVVDGPKPAETAVLLTVSDTGLDLVLDSQSAGWRDRPRTKGFSLTWAEVIARVVSGEFDHTTWSTDGHVPPTSTTESESTADDGLCGVCGLESGDPDCGCVCDCHHTCGDDEPWERLWEMAPDPHNKQGDDDEHVSRCGYCGEVIDFCQGHGEDEQSEFGFAPDSDEYDARREAFEAVDESSEDPRLCDCGKGDWCPLWGSWNGPGKTAWRLRMNNEEALTNG